MATHHNKLDNILEIWCDECGFDTVFEGEDWREGMYNAKEGGWRNVKSEGKWFNICPACT